MIIDKGPIFLYRLDMRHFRVQMNSKIWTSLGGDTTHAFCLAAVV